MKRIAILCGLVAALATGSARADVIISEIMYNPNSSEMSPILHEWIEIYNTGNATVDITGWTIRDEDGTSTTVLPTASIAPGEAVVLYSDNLTESQWQTAWDSDNPPTYQYFQVGIDDLNNLSNSPSATNEILELIDEMGNTIDVVNYDDSGDWPGSNNASSIYVLPTALTGTEGNDSGLSWGLSQAGVHGAFNASASPNSSFSDADIGSPGFVLDQTIPEPTSTALIGLALAGAALIRRRK